MLYKLQYIDPENPRMAFIDYNDTISERKRHLKVVIFGPYSAMARLRRIKAALRADDYSNANYVEDLPNPPELENQSISNNQFSYRKSVRYLRSCEVALFVLYNNVDIGNVETEIEHFLSNMSDRVNCASFIFEKGVRLRGLVSGAVEMHIQKPDEFVSDEEAIAYAKVACWNHLVQDDCERNGLHMTTVFSTNI